MTRKVEQEKLSQPSSLLRSSGIVGLMTLLSRFLGLARDVVVANYFGASNSADAFFVAFKIPNFFRRLFAEGAFSQAFVPVLSEYRTSGSKQAVKALVDAVAGTLGVSLLAITVIALLATPFLAMLFAPGFYLQGTQQFGLVTDLLRITFPYLLLISLTAFAGAILNSYGRFAVPAFTPVLLNLSLIASAIFLSPLFAEPIFALAWGVVIAGLVQLVFQLPFLWRIGLLPHPAFKPKDEGVKRILTLMLPAIFGVSVTQINLLLDTLLASFLQVGSVSWLYYSDRLAELPLGLFAIAIATVILPSLSHKHASRSAAEFSATLDWSLRLILLLGLPAASALFILATPLLSSLFHYGATTDNDILMSSLSLQAYAFGLVAFMLIKVLATGYFSRQDIRTPVKIGIQAALANMFFNLLLIYPFVHVGLAAATSMSAWLNAGLLLYGLVKTGILQWQPGWAVFMSRLLLANVAMAAILLWVAGDVHHWLDWPWQERLEQLAGLVLTGLFSYFSLLYVMGVRWSHMSGHAAPKS